jgi:hypothetical protein
MKVLAHPASGGEPLWHVPGDLTNSPQGQSDQKVSQQAAPGNDPERGVYRWLRSVYTRR